MEGNAGDERLQMKYIFLSAWSLYTFGGIYVLWIDRESWDAIIAYSIITLSLLGYLWTL